MPRRVVDPEALLAAVREQQPTSTERLRRSLQWCSRSRVHYHLMELRRRGLVDWTIGKHRTIRLTQKGQGVNAIEEELQLAKLTDVELRSMMDVAREEINRLQDKANRLAWNHSKKTDLARRIHLHDWFLTFANQWMDRTR